MVYLAENRLDANRGIGSPNVTGLSQQVHSVLVCFMSLLHQNLPENVCHYCYYYYYYTEVNGEMVRQAALRTKGAGGPSGVDANGFRRILACKSFKQSSTRLCEAIATMTRTLCTQYIDPMTIEPLVANRLISTG